MLKEVGLESRLEGGERGLQTQGKRKCSRLMGHRQRKSGDQRWRVWSEGCAGKEGERWSEESERVCRGGVSWRGRWEQSC